MLGGLRLLRGTTVVTHFKTRRVAALLARLACFPHRTHLRDMLAEELWPEEETEVVRERFRRTLALLREVLEPEGISSGSVLAADRSQVRLVPERFTTDVAEFESALRRADGAPRREIRRSALEQAIALYRGELLPGFYEDHFLPEQTRLAERYLIALEQFAQMLGEDGKVSEALEIAQRAISVDPLREDLCAILMRLLAQARRAPDALRQYQELERRMRQELKTAPSDALRRLYQQIERGEHAPPSLRTEPAFAVSAPEPPTGCVTFLFTDIEGSTRLWEEHPEAMRSALALHDRLLRDCIGSNGGYVFKTVGDAFCAAFPTPLPAVQASLDIQRDLLRHFPETTEAEKDQALSIDADPLPIRVRIALLTGEAEHRDNDYFGPSLNRIARLLAIGHGGQVLLAQSTQSQIQETLPAGLSLRSHGEHRLRDLNRPETVYQLHHPDLPPEFPALRSLSSPELPNNLPLQLTTFIGREKELAEVRGLLTNHRLVTLTGIGGNGKTRLSLEIGAESLPHYRDGVWLIDLAPLNDPTLVAQTVATALGVREESDRPLVQTLSAHLKSRSLLLLFDNCEHLLHAVCVVVETLLLQCPHLRVLATSREALNLPGEAIYRLPSLSIPTLLEEGAFPGIESLEDSLMRWDAPRLFVERARTVQASFDLNETNALAVARVCQYLDGIPLAIEMAAVRTKALPIEQIARRLDDRFRLLTVGHRTAQPRQQTLRALIDWSYDLLTTQEQTLLRRVSVFAGGWTLEAVEAVCTDEEIPATASAVDPSAPRIALWEALDLLTALVEKSLVVFEEASGTARYRLLETVRQYATDRLSESGASDAFQARHRNYFLALAEEIRPRLEGAEQAYWLNVLEADHDNLRAGIRYSMQDPEGGEAALRLVNALQRFWATRGHFREGRQHFAEALSHPAQPQSSSTRGLALNGAGSLALLQSDYPAARSLHEEGLALFRELGDERGVASALNSLGNLAHEEGDYAASRLLHEEGLALRRKMGDPRGAAASLGNLGNIALRQGDYAVAQHRYEECLTTFRDLEDRRGIALAVSSLGNVCHYRGDYIRAETLHRESLAILEELGDRAGIANSLNNLANAVLYQGDYEEARKLHEESLTIRRTLGDRWGIAASLTNMGLVASRMSDCISARSLLRESLTIKYEVGDKRGIVETLEALASLAFTERQTREAVTVWGAAEVLRSEIGLSRPLNEDDEYDRQTTEARTILGETAFRAAWKQGAALVWDQAVAYVLNTRA